MNPLIYFCTMINIMKHPKLLAKVVNKQFNMIGHSDINIYDIEHGVKIKDGKKEKIVDWWHVYKFENEQQYQDWKVYVFNELSKQKEDEYNKSFLESDMMFIDLLFGMTVKIKKEGEESPS